MKHVWEGNHTHLKVCEETNDEDQQWTYHNDVIRHTADGRALDIAYWKFTVGNEVNLVPNHFDQTG